MIAGDEFRLGFGEVEGSAVRFGVGGHDVDEEANDLEAPKDVPAKQAVCALAVDDIAKAKRLRAEDDANK